MNSWKVDIASAGILSLLCAALGCSTVQKVTNAVAEKYGGTRGRVVLDEFRYAEGASVGMVDTRGAYVSEGYVDDDGTALTNGVNKRLVVDRPLVSRVKPLPAGGPAGPSLEAEAKEKLNALLGPED